MRGLLFISLISGLFLAALGQGDNSTSPTSTTSVPATNGNITAPVTNPGSNDTNSTSVPATNGNITAPVTNPGSNDTNSTSVPATNGNITAPTANPGSNDTASTSAQGTSTLGDISNNSTISPTTPSTNVTDNSTNPNITEPNVTSTATTTRTETSATTSKPKVCTATICGNQSTCLQLADSYVCQCPLNYYYIESDLTCNPGESFYGDLQVAAANFNPDKNSQEYNDIYNNVINNFTKCFENSTGYLGTVIVEMRAISARNSRSTVSVSVKMSHIFTPKTTNEIAVTSAVKSYIEAVGSSFGPYNAKNLCDDGFYCDLETTTCTLSGDGQSAICTCKPGRFSSKPIYLSCRECDPTCAQTEGRHCVQKTASNLPQCACLPGYQQKEEKCTKCEYGYSGENCKDNFLLILVIVGAVLGAVVIILLGAVIGVTVRSKKGKGENERTKLIDNFDKIDKVSADASPGPGSLFPKVRVKPDLGQENRASTIYDENEEFSRSIPKRDYEENPWYEMSRKERNY